MPSQPTAMTSRIPSIRHARRREIAFATALLLMAGTRAWAAGAPTGAAPAPVYGDADFDDVFMQKPKGTHVDVSRFRAGNATLPGHVRADLVVNKAWLGRVEVQLRPTRADGGDVQPCFTRALLEQIGIDVDRLPPDAFHRLDQGAATCATLPDLVADARADFDNDEQRLDVTVPQVALSNQPRGYVDPQSWDEGVTAARLQYNANLYHSVSQGMSAMQGYLGIDGGFNLGPWRLHHAGNLTYGEAAGTPYQSVQTNLQRSIAAIRGQLTLGDAFTEGRIFDSVGFRGVQLTSDDRMVPDSQRGYAPVVRGIANSNARVQVRQNGNILYETTVAPGAFEIKDLYPTGYGGDLEVTVTEADGSVRISRIPYAAAVHSLRPGTSHYSVTAGQYRNPSIRDTPLLLQATFEHGFTNLLTGYGGTVLAQDYAAVLAGASLNTVYGALGADLTHSMARLPFEAGRNGWSLRLAYSKLVETTHTNVSLAAFRYSSSGYLSLADAVALHDLDTHGVGFAMTGIQRGRVQVTMNQTLPRDYGALYLAGSAQSYWNRGGSDTQFQFGYSNSWRRLTYGVSASRQFDLNTGRWDTRVMLDVDVPLGRGQHAPYLTTSVQHDASGATGTQQSLTGTWGADNALSYGLHAAYSGGGNTAMTRSIGANASYASPVATLTGSVSRSDGYTQTSAGIAGGILAYAGGVTFAPTLGETLAVVEARDAAGAHIVNGRGITVDRWGHAVVPDLTPFASNEVDIDPKGLPVNVEFQSTAQHVTPTVGAVVRVRFETESVGRTAILHATTAGGRPLPFGAEALDADGQSVGTVGQAGQLYVHRLNAGAGVLTLRWGQADGERCALHYALPPDDARPQRKVVRADAACS